MDEADACVLQHREAMRAVLGAACTQEDKPTLAFVGASIDADFKEELVRERWLSFPVTLEGSGPGLVPPSIQHRCGGRVAARLSPGPPLRRYMRGRGCTVQHRPCMCGAHAANLDMASRYQRVKGRSHTVEERIGTHPQKPHAWLVNSTHLH